MQGDLEAFYLRHFKAIYRVCYAFMKNAQDAEDCTEDAFVKAMTSDVTFENERHSARLLWRGMPMRPRRKAMRPQRSYRSPPAARRHGGSGTARWPRASRW